MKAVLWVGVAATVCVGGVVALFFGSGRAADPAPPTAAPMAKAVSDTQASLVMHEWGTFTSFAGSDGVPVHFRPNNLDLPHFVYFQEDLGGKGSQRFLASGTVSLETPVLYFYSDRAMPVSVKVDFPQGWITEWYPFAAAAPAHPGEDVLGRGQKMCWQIQLMPGEKGTLPDEHRANSYYHARSTESTILQAEFNLPPEEQNARIRGGKIVQQEKFLFYRGVGAFAPPVTVVALGADKLKIRNTTAEEVASVFLVQVRDGKIGFRNLGVLASKGEMDTTLPTPDGSSAGLRAGLTKELTAAGLYGKEAEAMVNTWESAWMGEEGTRVLYLVPRTRTDALLPLTIDPKPTSMVRVMVGRHDFLTPEVEDNADRLARRIQSARAELEAAGKQLQHLGRFGPEAHSLAEIRMQKKTTGIK